MENNTQQTTETAVTPDEVAQYIDSLPDIAPDADKQRYAEGALALIIALPPILQGMHIKRLAKKLGLPVGDLRDYMKLMAAKPKKAPDAADKDEPTWKKQLARSLNGALKGTLANAMLYLANEWAGCVGYDEFAHVPVWMSEPQWDPTERPKKAFQVGQELEDEDAARLQAWLGRRGCDVNYDTAFRALDLAAQNNSFHPIRDYLNTVEWDGVQRVEKFYATFYGTPDNEYTRLVSRIQLVSSVARIYRPGCKVDTMPILEGEQGLRGSADQQQTNGMLGKGKSSSFKALYGAKYFTDHISELGSKDSFMELQNVWCAEMAELDTLTRVDANQAKKFISSAVDKYRPAYGRRVKAYPRQSVLIGSTNPGGDLGYLKDQTGARRFLPLAVASCDIDGIERDRDQLWAEAVHMFRAGVKWWATKDEEAVLEVEQDKRRQADPWEDVIARFVARFDHATVTSTYLLEQAIGMTPERMQGYYLTRIGSVMKRLAWQGDRVERSGHTIRFYRRPGSAPFEVRPDYSIDPIVGADDGLGLSEDELAGAMAGTPAADTGTPAQPCDATNTADTEPQPAAAVEEWHDCLLVAYARAPNGSILYPHEQDDVIDPTYPRYVIVYKEDGERAVMKATPEFDQPGYYQRSTVIIEREPDCLPRVTEYELHPSYHDSEGTTFLTPREFTAALARSLAEKGIAIPA